MMRCSSSHHSTMPSMVVLRGGVPEQIAEDVRGKARQDRGPADFTPTDSNPGTSARQRRGGTRTAWPSKAWARASVESAYPAAEAMGSGWRRGGVGAPGCGSSRPARPASGKRRAKPVDNSVRASSRARPRTFASDRNSAGGQECPGGAGIVHARDREAAKSGSQAMFAEQFEEGATVLRPRRRHG
jgi:hypothetical protein